jgi:hypothetical protein
MTAGQPGRFGDGLTGAKSELWLSLARQIDFYDDPGTHQPFGRCRGSLVHPDERESRKEKL